MPRRTQPEIDIFAPLTRERVPAPQARRVDPSVGTPAPRTPTVVPTEQYTAGELVDLTKRSAPGSNGRRTLRRPVERGRRASGHLGAFLRRHRSVAVATATLVLSLMATAASASPIAPMILLGSVAAEGVLGARAGVRLVRRVAANLSMRSDQRATEYGERMVREDARFARQQRAEGPGPAALAGASRVLPQMRASGLATPASRGQVRRPVDGPGLN